MSMEHIRKTYRVPAKRGGRVRFTQSDGVVWEGRIRAATRGGLLYICPDLSPKTRFVISPQAHGLEYLP